MIETTVQGGLGQMTAAMLCYVWLLRGHVRGLLFGIKIKLPLSMVLSAFIILFQLQYQQAYICMFSASPSNLR